LISPVPFFCLKIALAIQGFLYFHTNYEIICSSSLKNTVGILIGIALNLLIALGSILIFTILILLIHELGIFLHLFDNKWTTWKKWDEFLEKYNLPKLNQEKIEDLDGPITCTK